MAIQDSRHPNIIIYLMVMIKLNLSNIKIFSSTEISQPATYPLHPQARITSALSKTPLKQIQAVSDQGGENKSPHGEYPTRHPPLL